MPKQGGGEQANHKRATPWLSWLVPSFSLSQIRSSKQMLAHPYLCCLRAVIQAEKGKLNLQINPFQPGLALPYMFANSSPPYNSEKEGLLKQAPGGKKVGYMQNVASWFCCDVAVTSKLLF